MGNSKRNVFTIIDAFPIPSDKKKMPINDVNLSNINEDKNVQLLVSAIFEHYTRANESSNYLNYITSVFEDETHEMFNELKKLDSYSIDFTHHISSETIQEILYTYIFSLLNIKDYKIINPINNDFQIIPLCEHDIKNINHNNNEHPAPLQTLATYSCWLEHIKNNEWWGLEHALKTTMNHYIASNIVQNSLNESPEVEYAESSIVYLIQKILIREFQEKHQLETITIRNQKESYRYVFNTLMSEENIETYISMLRLILIGFLIDAFYEENVLHKYVKIDDTNNTVSLRIKKLLKYYYSEQEKYGINILHYSHINGFRNNINREYISSIYFVKYPQLSYLYEKNMEYVDALNGSLKLYVDYFYTLCSLNVPYTIIEEYLQSIISKLELLDDELFYYHTSSYLHYFTELYSENNEEDKENNSSNVRLPRRGFMKEYNKFSLELKGVTQYMYPSALEKRFIKYGQEHNMTLKGNDLINQKLFLKKNRDDVPLDLIVWLLTQYGYIEEELFSNLKEYYSYVKETLYDNSENLTISPHDEVLQKINMLSDQNPLSINNEKYKTFLTHLFYNLYVMKDDEKIREMPLSWILEMATTNS